jgi:hypothetical protein
LRNSSNTIRANAKGTAISHASRPVAAVPKNALPTGVATIASASTTPNATPQIIRAFPRRPVESTDLSGLRQRNTFALCITTTAMRHAVVAWR